LSLAKVAIALDVSPGTVLKMVEDGRLPRPRVWGRRKLWRVAEIDAALAEWPIDGEEADVFEDDKWVAE
jgi:excisionase family DNA binding protein